VAARGLTRRLGWATSVTALASASFLVLFLVSSEIPELRAQSPWQDDPWDAAMSVAFLFVPIVGAVSAVRVVRLLVDPRPAASTARFLLRGLTVGLVLVTLAVAACLAAAVMGAHVETWGPATGALVALAASTGLLVLVAAALVGFAVLTTRGLEPSPTGRDVLSDLLESVALLVGSDSTAADELRRLDARLDIVAWSPRRHATLFGASVAVLFGTSLATWHLLAEGAPLAHLLAAWAAYALVAAAVCFAGWVVLRPMLRIIDERPRRRP
jgi:hypothetical protein